MNLSGLLDALRNQHHYNALLNTLQSTDPIHPQAIIRSARPYVIAQLARDWQAPILVMTTDGRRAHNIAEQLPVWLGDDADILRFAEPTTNFYDRIAWDLPIIYSRITTLARLQEPSEERPLVIVASARALMQRTLSRELLQQNQMTIRVGERFSLENLLRTWTGWGYEAVSTVVETGTFSRRGGILDIYPIDAVYPIRVEFFDDEIDSLRQFNPATQRSIESVNSFRILPAREVLSSHTQTAADALATWLDQLEAIDERYTPWRNDLEALQNQQSFPTAEYYLPFCYPDAVTILDHLPDNTLVVADNIENIQSIVQDLDQQAQQNHDQLATTQQIPSAFPSPYVNWDSLHTNLQEHMILNLNNSPQDTSSSFGFTAGKRYGGQLRPMLRDWREQLQNGDQIVVVTQQTERLKNLWYEQDASERIPSTDTVNSLPEQQTIVLVPDTLQNGWSIPTQNTQLHLITDSEIFGWSRPEPRRRQTKSKKLKQRINTDYLNWQPGDYVVHIDMGIGRFVGLQHRTVEDTEREYLVIEYAGTDKMYVAIHQSDRLTRYIGADDIPPKLSKLGKPTDWLKKRNKAKRNAEEEARELLKIYAQRAKAPGIPYSEDGAWAHELAASFPYVETEDQLRVMQEVIKDMESPTPMDRLVCGDVGFGKTEIAIRAAFKAATDGKQVAILVPTTVLAQQHYETFQRRLQAFPLQVEMLSRFRTKAQQTATTKGITNGTVDIVIGTHRILSDDVRFKDLGLVIIDEEQRFGVKHKEHFKQFRAQIDVLTLTATPIPRTLYMSLSGIRDISMIQTPPEERLPVVTQISTFDEKLARQAILRELDRGGQVFIIHNRVKSIEMIREKFQEIVPEASIVVAHGQMSPRQLEGIIAAFSRREYDILLATSIIENGIDMPNVNTLIVDRADWFGISQLYQLRGRVGRSAQQAYTYFFHPGYSKLTEEAKARLETLAENTELGAGFQISIRDLEIRGAGDILSMRQTGHVAAIGLHLYTQLLNQAINTLKGDIDASNDTTPTEEKIVIDLPIAAYIPNDWVPEMATRLQLYRQIGGLQTEANIEDMRTELRDRFGQLPNAVEGLLYQMQIKLLAIKIRATAIVKPRQHILIKLPYLPSVDREQLAQGLGEDVEVSRTAVELAFDKDIWQWRLLDIMKEIAGEFATVV